MNILRWLVHSRIWVALAAAAWSVESFFRCDQWVRWTLVAHIFFLAWSAYLFLSDDAMRKYRLLVLTALTGVCVTFQGFESLAIPAFCSIPVLFYRTHWMPRSWWLSRWELRSIAIVNNAAIAFCWVVLCMVWPLHQCAASRCCFAGLRCNGCKRCVQRIKCVRLAIDDCFASAPSFHAGRKAHGS